MRDRSGPILLSVILLVVASPVRAADRVCRPVAQAATVAAHKPVFVEGATIALADLRADLDSWQAQMAAIHPDLALRTDRRGFDAMHRTIIRDLKTPLSQRQAWLSLARLNPFLGDGHSGILPPDYRGQMRAHLDAGGRLFPLGIQFGDDGGLRVQTAPDGTAARGTHILSINGVSADRIGAMMLARTEGDTPAFRRALAGRRFAFLYQTLFGDTGRYAIRMRRAGGCVAQLFVDGATTLPPYLRSPEPGDDYSWRVLDGDIGYLKARSFAFENKQAFAGFTKAAFADFKARGIRALIIDVRDNGGGDDPLWQEGLMENIAAQPYSHVSRYATRVTEQNIDPGETVGAVRRRDYPKRMVPAAENPLRFDGPVYVLAGHFTYSAAIQFVVAAQDFGIARIAGAETGALSCQTGRVKPITLAHSGLNAFTPAMTFIRPSGKGCERGVIPDIAIDDDGLDPARAPELLAGHIRREMGMPK